MTVKEAAIIMLEILAEIEPLEMEPSAERAKMLKLYVAKLTALATLIRDTGRKV